MLTPEIINHFSLNRDPFVDEFDAPTKTFTFESHAIAEAMMWQAALRRGFVAIAGQFGSGKSILLRRVMAQITKTHPHVTIVECPTTAVENLTDAGLMELLLCSLAPEDTVPATRIRRGLKLSRMLKAMHAQKKVVCLVIDEAHRLGVKSFMALKGLYEYTADAHRLLGIILTGKPELAQHLKNVTIPDVAARVEVVALDDMGRDAGAYLEWKMRQAGKQAKDVFTDEAIAAMLTNLNGDATPLGINNLATCSMRLACWTGQQHVTDDIVIQAMQEVS